MDKHPTSQTVIRFQDCDAFGHLNKARYINYFINAREDHLRDYYAFDLYKHAHGSGENWYITHHEIAYLRPAHLGERVRIQTGLIGLTANGIVLEGVMTDATGQQLKAVQRTTFRYVNLQTGRSATHPPDVAAFLASILIEEEIYPEDLNQRLRQLKARHRTAVSRKTDRQEAALV